MFRFDRGCRLIIQSEKLGGKIGNSDLDLKFG
jgi:hypothetical protein